MTSRLFHHGESDETMSRQRLASLGRCTPGRLNTIWRTSTCALRHIHALELVFVSAYMPAETPPTRCFEPCRTSRDLADRNESLSTSISGLDEHTQA
jgi:hypothetical protein